jgi:hypothetical protein
VHGYDEKIKPVVKLFFVIIKKEFFKKGRQSGCGQFVDSPI